MTDSTHRLGICAGEASGDILAGAMLRCWRQRLGPLSLSGIGGERMQAEGLQSLYPIDRLSVMGLVEPIKRLPELLRIRRDLICQQLQQPPQLFVGVDSPDFNLPVARRLKRAGIPTAHLVSPSVWAWRQGRIRSIRESVDKMLCLLPFEVEVYHRAGIDAVCVGHPLADDLNAMPAADVLRNALALPADRPLVAVLPGSREAEVRHLLPVFVDTLHQLQRHDASLHFVVPAANEARYHQITAVLQDSGLSFTITRGQGREVMRASDAVLIASGTATLEAMLLGKPMVIAYRMSAISWQIMSRMARTPFVGLPNILAGDAVVPELLQGAATPERLAQAMLEILGPQGEAQSARFAELAGQIGGDFAQRSVAALEPLLARA